MTKNSKIFLFIVCAFFFISGLCGLVYQVLWSKYLSNIFGSSAYAHTIVLAVFMGGLAFGNHYLGRMADRTKINLLYFYGVLEIAIGFYCLLYPNLATLIENFYISIGRQLGLASTSPTLLVIQFFLNGLSIFIPTAIMGGTLPVMAKYITQTRSEIINKVSLLYFINSAGAVIGSLVAGFFFIKLWGLDFSITVAAALNTLIGIISVLIVKRWPDLAFEQTPTISDSSPEFEEREERDPVKLRLMLWAITLSGFVSMLYEVVWIRTLVQFFGSSVYSFSIVVGAFIAGISLGSAWLSARSQYGKDIYKSFGTIQAIIAVTMFLGYANIELLAQWIWVLFQAFNPNAYAYPLFLFTKFLTVFFLLIIPTFFIGMTLPMASAFCTENVKIMGKDVGNVFSVNTVGALLGTAITGLVLMPTIGSTVTFKFGIAINLLLACMIFITADEERRYYKNAAFWLVIICLISVVNPIKDPRSLMLTTMFRNRVQGELSFREYLAHKLLNRHIAYFKEDMNANIAIIKINGKPSLFINGKPDASDSLYDMPTQLLSGHLPALMHPNPKRALVIGFGSGVTVGALTLHPSIEKVDVLEITEGVIEAGVHFSHINYDCLNNEKVNVIIDDAKNFLSLNKEKYDLIVSEPTNPWTVGTASLMSKEAFIRIKNSLNEGGILLQWFHTYEMSDRIYNSFGTTITEQFPYISVWQSNGADTFFIATEKPQYVDVDRIKKEIENDLVLQKSLETVHADNVFSLLSTQVLTEDVTRNLFHKVSMPNYDRFPTIEFNAPKAFFIGSRTSIMSDADLRNRPFIFKGHWVKNYIANNPLTDEDIKKLYKFLFIGHSHLFERFNWVYIDRLMELYADDPKEKLYLKSFKIDKDIQLKRIADYAALVAENPESYEVYEKYLTEFRVNYLNGLSIYNENIELGKQYVDALKQGLELFPEESHKFYNLLGALYAYQYDFPKAFDAYVLAAQSQKDLDELEDRALYKSYLRSALDVAVKGSDVNRLGQVSAIINQKFPADQKLAKKVAVAKKFLESK